MPAVLSRVLGQTELPEYVGVAFRRYPQFDGYHAAIVYRGSDRSCHLLHLASHRDLQDEPEEVTDRGSGLRKYIIVVPKLTRTEGTSIATYFARVHRANYGRKTIPLSAQYDEGIKVDPVTLEVIRESGLAGMSCATFVLHMFRAFGIVLLDATNCPAQRPGDSARR